MYFDGNSKEELTERVRYDHPAVVRFFDEHYVPEGPHRESVDVIPENAKDINLKMFFDGNSEKELVENVRNNHLALERFFNGSYVPKESDRERKLPDYMEPVIESKYYTPRGWNRDNPDLVYNDATRETFVEPLNENNYGELTEIGKIHYFYLEFFRWLAEEGICDEDGWKICLFDCFDPQSETNERYPEFREKSNFNEFDLTDRLSRSAKPDPAIYFSDIVLSENPRTSWVSYWIETEMIERIDPINCKFFIVAKLDESKLFQEAKYYSYREKVMRTQRQSHPIYTNLDWKKIAGFYSGVSIPNPIVYERGNRPENTEFWTVPTWIIWDSDAILDKEVFTLEDIPSYITSILDM